MAQQKLQYALVIDSRRCINCKACIVACRAENEVPLGHSRLRISEENRGIWPQIMEDFEPGQCNHCESPSCVRVCPTGASYKREDGIVLINVNECIGCRYCIIACPYNARFAREDLGHPEKCTYCVQRLDRGRPPACVETCPSKVRIFGDKNDPKGKLAEILNTRRYRVQKPETGNGPQIFYLL
jgi:tetrathionate reductase subunit B